MEQGILKKHLLSLKTQKGADQLNQKFQYITIFKHYILCFRSEEDLCDCIVFDTESGKTTKALTGLNLGARSGYSFCYWKDDTYVLFGGSTPSFDAQAHRTRGPTMQKVYDVQLLQVIEENSKISFHAKSCGVKAEEWWTAQHTAEVSKDNLYIIGGSQGQGVNSDHPLQVWKFDLNENTWSKCEIEGEELRPRWNLASALFGKKIYLFGGYVAVPSLPKRANDIIALDVENMVWEKIREDNVLQISLINSTERLQVEKIDQKIYIGGQKLEEFTIFDPINNTLEQSQGVAPKEGFRIRSNGNHIMLFRFLFTLQKLPDVEFQNFYTEEEVQPSVIARNHILSQANHMEILWKEKPFADVTFVVQGEEIKAHRNILIKCHYFQNMFNSIQGLSFNNNLISGGMMEANAAKINVPEISSTNFKAILEYIYFGKIVLTEQLAMDLVIVADMYCMAELKADCEAYLSKNMKAENLLAIIKTAETADSPKLENKIISFLVTNIDKLKDTMDVDSIPHPLLIKCMVKMNLALREKK